MKEKKIFNKWNIIWGIYLLWLALNFTIFAITGFKEPILGNFTYYYFYPFIYWDNLNDIINNLLGYYDFTEFLVYSVVPALIILSLKLIISNKNKQ